MLPHRVRARHAGSAASGPTIETVFDQIEILF